MANRCIQCGANLDMVGIAHRCIPNATPITPKWIAAAERGGDLMHEPATYRYRNEEQRRAYMREYMRRYRAPA